MKNYKFILGVSMLGLFSQVPVAATVLGVPADQEPYSPAGHHGTRNGGMAKGLPGSASATNLALMNVYPTAVQFFIPGYDGTYTPSALLTFSSSETVNDLKSRIITSYRLSAAIKFMVDGEEVMRHDVIDGQLVQLKDAFSGKGGIVQIRVVKDNTRSPMHSAMPTPEPGSPSEPDEVLLPPADRR